MVNLLIKKINNPLPSPPLLYIVTRKSTKSISQSDVLTFSFTFIRYIVDKLVAPISFKCPAFIPKPPPKLFRIFVDPRSHKFDKPTDPPPDDEHRVLLDLVTMDPKEIEDEERKHTWSLPPWELALFQTPQLFLDLTQIPLTEQPKDGGKIPLSDTTAQLHAKYAQKRQDGWEDDLFLIPHEELQRTGGKVPPHRMPKPKSHITVPSAPAPMQRSMTPQTTVASSSATQSPIKRQQVRNRSDLARLIDRTFLTSNSKTFLTDLKHPTKPSLKAISSVPLIPTGASITLPPLHVNLCTLDQDCNQPEGAILKAMSSPSNPEETFIWLYTNKDKTKVKHQGHQQLYTFERDFDIQRTDRAPPLLAFYIPQSLLVNEEDHTKTITKTESIMYSIIDVNYALRRRRGKASESLRKAQPKLMIHRITENDHEAMDEDTDGDIVIQ